MGPFAKNVRVKCVKFNITNPLFPPPTQNFFLPRRFKRKIKTEKERRADIIAQEKADEELQAARMRELFGECKQETTELIVDMEPESLEPVKQVTIDEEDALKEKAKLREKQQKAITGTNLQSSSVEGSTVPSSKDTKGRGVKQAFSEPELRIDDKESRDLGGADSQRHGYKRIATTGGGGDVCLCLEGWRELGCLN